MLYRLLRTREDWEDGLSANSPNLDISALNHVINGSQSGWKSQYIATCGSLNAVLMFRRKSRNKKAPIVQISEDNLPVVKIDLRTWSNRRKHYERDIRNNLSINNFNYFARIYEVVLLVGYVPRTHIQLMDESDFDCEQLRE